MEEVWDDGEVASGCEVVGDELSVGEGVAVDVCEEEDGMGIGR